MITVSMDDRVLLVTESVDHVMLLLDELGLLERLGGDPGQLPQTPEAAWRRLREKYGRHGFDAFLADGIGVSRAAVGQWKKAVPRGRAHDVARFLGIDISEVRPDMK